jgi:hypothetical protein
VVVSSVLSLLVRHPATVPVPATTTASTARRFNHIFTRTDDALRQEHVVLVA